MAMSWLTKKYQRLSLVLLVVLLTSYLMYFPGQQSWMAFQIGSGLFNSSLQSEITRIEEKVKNKESLNEAEKQYLIDLYTCFWRGARLTYIYRQTAHLMEHYLSGKGEDLEIEPRIFIGSIKVKNKMVQMRYKLQLDLEKKSNLLKEYSSETFYMGDSNFPDSHTGLYTGKLSATILEQSDNKVKIEWKFDHPWKWPSFSYIEEEFGDISSHDFPIPNMMSLIFGEKHALWINDGLGAHLEKIGLAKSFHVTSNWNEEVRL